MKTIIMRNGLTFNKITLSGGDIVKRSRKNKKYGSLKESRILKFVNTPFL